MWTSANSPERCSVFIQLPARVRRRLPAHQRCASDMAITLLLDAVSGRTPPPDSNSECSSPYMISSLDVRHLILTVDLLLQILSISVNDTHPSSESFTHCSRLFSRYHNSLDQNPLLGLSKEAEELLRQSTHVRPRIRILLYDPLQTL